MPFFQNSRFSLRRAKSSQSLAQMSTQQHVPGTSGTSGETMAPPVFVNPTPPAPIHQPTVAPSAPIYLPANAALSLPPSVDPVGESVRTPLEFGRQAVMPQFHGRIEENAMKFLRAWAREAEISGWSRRQMVLRLVNWLRGEASIW